MQPDLFPVSTSCHSVPAVADVVLLKHRAVILLADHREASWSLFVDSACLTEAELLLDPLTSPCCIWFLGVGGMFPQELAQKIRGYQEQIASLNSKCKLLTMKAKHATMLLTVTEVEGLSEGMEELDSEDLLPTHSTHPSVVMVRNAFTVY